MGRFDLSADNRNVRNDRFCGNGTRGRQRRRNRFLDLCHSFRHKRRLQLLGQTQRLAPYLADAPRTAGDFADLGRRIVDRLRGDGESWPEEACEI